MRVFLAFFTSPDPVEGSLVRGWISGFYARVERPALRLRSVNHSLFFERSSNGEVSSESRDPVL